jgi:hypothetical protein
MEEKNCSIIKIILNTGNIERILSDKGQLQNRTSQVFGKGCFTTTENQ